ncbi:hypothetical protein BdWA1_002266 [Babesia duncani]|uniref:Uncharacterized protein n=1 Tax=Babesia duncani TaxID=323732 RepID=A0AAD9PJT3_9APIC|nr:hypothetical protein BdWA1_002266 [Babesia duncani]
MDLRWLLSIAIIGCKLAAGIGYNDEILAVKEGSLPSDGALFIYDGIRGKLSEHDALVSKLVENSQNNITELDKQLEEGQITTKENYNEFFNKLTNTLDEMGHIRNYIGLIPELIRNIEMIKEEMHEWDRRTLGDDLTMRVKTVMAGKRELKEKLKIELQTVTAKINVLPIKKEVGKNSINALALELTNSEIHIRENETIISQDVGKCREKLAGSKYLTMQERNAMASEILVMRMLINGMEGAMKALKSAEKEIEELKMGMTEEELKMFDSEIMQHTIITGSESKKVVERLEKDILHLENQITAIPIEN